MTNNNNRKRKASIMLQAPPTEHHHHHQDIPLVTVTGFCFVSLDTHLLMYIFVRMTCQFIRLMTLIRIPIVIILLLPSLLMLSDLGKIFTLNALFSNETGGGAGSSRLVYPAIRTASCVYKSMRLSPSSSLVPMITLFVFGTRIPGNASRFSMVIRVVCVRFNLTILKLYLVLQTSKLAVDERGNRRMRPGEITCISNSSISLVLFASGL